MNQQRHTSSKAIGCNEKIDPMFISNPAVEVESRLFFFILLPSSPTSFH
jgi:hypothetical protein